MLARWGDTKVLEWALAEGCSRGDDPWIPCYVFAVSPLPAAGAEITRLFGRPDATAAAFIVDGLASSARTDRLELVRAALSRFPSSSKLQDAARRALSALEQQGDSGAEALLATLPDEPDDD